MTTGGAFAWDSFADAVITRAAIRRRDRWKQTFDVDAGSVIDADEVDRLIGSLPTASDVAGSPVAGSTVAESSSSELDADVLAAAGRLHDEANDEPLAWIAAAAGLDDASAQVLALAIGIAWSPVRQQLLGYVQDDLTVRGLMVASIPSLLDLPLAAVAIVAPDAALRRACLIDVDDRAAIGAATVVVATPVLWYAVGDESRDPDLPAAATIYPGEPACNPGRWLVHGGDRVRRVQAAAELIGTSRVVVTPEPTTSREWAALVRTAVCRTSGIVIESSTSSPEATGWIDRADTVSWVLASPHQLSLHDLPLLSFAEREAAAAETTDAEIGPRLASLPGGQRLRAEQLVLLNRISGIDAQDSIRRLATGELDRLTNRVHPRFSWNDLVLTEDKLARVREVVVRVQRHDTVYRDWGFSTAPSDGVVALFSGPPGTGKTMAAEIIAGELGLDMYKVNLSSIVSKYIGETEKHLERLFDAAEGGGVLLVFDEADALFGKRTAVDDSHDRYANIETSYMLQRLESYDGLTILTSNLATNIDEAFQRRIHVSVEFTIPEAAERLQIWKSAFPAGAPMTDDVDLEFVADRIKFAGGSIRTSSLTAAFAAAGEGVPISMRHIVHGLRREYQKLGRMITASDFGPWFELASGGGQPGS